jgi:hypothetical protein
MPSCFNNSVKSVPTPVKPKAADNGLVEKFIVDNPLIFRVCCLCVARRRKRVDTAKQNGNANHIHDETILTIDQIEFTQSSVELNGK